jgi:hypothetical protein
MSAHAMDTIRCRIVPEEIIGEPSGNIENASGNVENHTDTPRYLTNKVFQDIQAGILRKIHNEIKSTFLDETTINNLLKREALFEWTEWQEEGKTKLLNAYATIRQMNAFDVWFLTKKRELEIAFLELRHAAAGMSEESKNDPYPAGALREALIQNTERLITLGPLRQRAVCRPKRPLKPVPHCSDPQDASPEGPTLEEGGDPRPLGDRVYIDDRDNGLGSTFTRYRLRMPPAMLRIATHSRSVK